MTDNSPIATIFSLLQEPKLQHMALADHIKKLSDFFVHNPDGHTPWDQDFCKIAYRYYYLPLNYIRNQQVIQRGLEIGFFQDINTTVDWGCGPGTASLALAHELSHITQQILIDRAADALSAFADLKTHLKSSQHLTQLKLKNLNIDYQKSLLVFSYSLTEMGSSLPEGHEQFPQIMILEPSTQDDGRKLLKLRQELIQKKYYIWAPCTHQNACPLLVHSKTDWCHDRFHVHAPEWFTKTESFLPFKNRTITTSYLLASKTPPPAHLKNYARIVGDSLPEKGKTRQLICRNLSPAPSEREFLAWLHKTKEPQIIPRGELVALPDNVEKKSNEIRLVENLKPYSK